MKLLFFLTFLLFYAPSVFSQNAEISVERGAFVKNFIDLFDSSSELPLEIRRTYDSTSKHTGLFGRGTCSLWEDRLTQIHKDQINFYPCGFGQNVQFQRSGQIFKSEIGFLKQTDAGFLLIDPQGLKREFSSDGKLTAWYYDSAQRGEIKWLKDGSIHIQSAAVVWKASVNSEGLIESVIGPRGQSQYKYKNKMLISMKNQWGTSQQYKYDQQQRVVGIQYSDKTSETIVYNNANQVSKYVGRNGCIESYDRKSNFHQDQMILTVEKKCSGQSVNKKTWTLAVVKGVVQKQTVSESLQKKKDSYGRVSSVDTRDYKLLLEYDKKAILPSVLVKMNKRKGVLGRYKLLFDRQGRVVEIEVNGIAQKKYQYNQLNDVIAVIQQDARQPASSMSKDIRQSVKSEILWVEVAQLLKLAGFR